MAAAAAAVAAAHLSAGVTPPRRLAPIPAASVSPKLPLRHTEPQPQPEPSPPALSGSPPRLLAGGVRGVDDDGKQCCAALGMGLVRDLPARGRGHVRRGEGITCAVAAPSLRASAAPGGA